MNSYSVAIPVTGSLEFIVNAENEAQALAQALEKLAKSLGMVNWDVKSSPALAEVKLLGQA